MARTFNSSIDMIILNDYVFKKLIELVEKWPKRTGNELYYRHKERHLKRMRQTQRRYTQSIAGTITQYCHDERDETAIYEIGRFTSYKSAELQGFTEPSNPWTEGETFCREMLRSDTPVTTELLMRATAELGRMMSEGVDPIEESKTNQIIMKDPPKQTDGGIIVPDSYFAETE